tara:strand:+ start:3512 stop:3631 length:120 start_codon:yes stop_codon:yes gene_type:complete
MPQALPVVLVEGHLDVKLVVLAKREAGKGFIPWPPSRTT